MGEKEDNVYKAKLAEQAERYDGIIRPFMLLFSDVEGHVSWPLGVKCGMRKIATG